MKTKSVSASLRFAGLPILIALLTLAFGSASSLQAAITGVWNTTTSGNWSASGNWTAAGIPTAAGDTANLAFNMAAACVITIDTTSRTVKTLTIGDPSSTFYKTTLAASGGATLTLNSGSGAGAAITETTANTAGDLISAPLVLADSVKTTVTPNILGAPTGLTLSGAITGVSGSTGLSLVGAAGSIIYLSGANSYTGPTVIGATAFVDFLNAGALTSGSGATVTVTSGGSIGLGVGTGGFASTVLNAAFSGSASGNLAAVPVGSPIFIDTSLGSFNYGSAIPASARSVNMIGATANTLTLSGATAAHTGGTALYTGNATITGDWRNATGLYSIGDQNPTNVTAANPWGFNGAVIFTISSGAQVASTGGFQLGVNGTAASGVPTVSVAGTVNNSGTLTLGREGVLNITAGGNWSQSGNGVMSGWGNVAASMNVTGSSGSPALFTYTGSSPFQVNNANGNYGANTILSINSYGTFSTSLGIQNANLSTGSGNAYNNLNYSEVSLNGGTLKFTADVASMISSTTASPLVFLVNNPSTIDTGSHAVGCANAITGGSAGSFTKIGSGTLTLSGPNAMTAGITVNAGTLQTTTGYSLGLYYGITTGATVGNTGVTVTPSGATTATLDLQGNINSDLPITLNGTATGGNSAVLVNSTAGSTSTLDNGISGVNFTSGGSGFSASDSLTFSGTGGGSGGTASLTFNLTGTSITASSLAGTWTNGNHLVIYATANPSVYADYSITTPTGGGTPTAVTLTTPNAIVGGFTAAQLSGGLSYQALKGTGALTPSGTSLPTINSASLAVNQINITSGGTGYSGTLSASVSGTGTGLTISHIYTASALTLTGTQNQIGSGTDGNLTINAPVTGGGFTKAGSSTLTLNGGSANTYSGAVTVSAGKLVVQSSQTGNGAITVNDGATLRTTLSGSSSLAPTTLTVGTSTGATLEFNSVNLSTAPIAATTFSQTGTTTIQVNTAAVAYAQGNVYKLMTGSGIGAANFSLDLTTLTALGVGAHLDNTVASGTELDLVIDSVSDIWTGTTSVWDTTTAGNWAGLANATGNIFVNGQPVLFDDSVGSGSTSVTVSAPVQPAAVLFNNSTKTYTITSSGANIITDSTSPTPLTKSGSGMTTLAGGVNTFTGPTTVSAGTLSVGVLANGGVASDLGKAANTAASVVLNGGTLQYTGSAQNSDHLFTVGAAGGAIDASGSGALNLNNTGTAVASGTGSRVLTLTGTSTAANTLAPVVADPSSGTTAVTKSGTGSWTLPSANTLSGGVNLTAGTLVLANNQALGAAVGTFTLAGGVLDSSVANLVMANNNPVAINGDFTFAGSQNLNLGTGNVTLGGSGTTRTITTTAGNLTLGGVIASGTTGLTKAGSGLLTLSGASTYSGATTLSAGELDATTSASALGAGSLALGGGTLRLANDTGLNFGRNTTVSQSMTIKSDRLTAGAGVNHTLGTLGIGTQTLTVAGGANVTSGTAGLTFGATTTSAGTTVIDVASGMNLTLGALAGSGNTMTKQNSGTLTLNATSSRGAVSDTFNITGGTAVFAGPVNSTDDSIGRTGVTLGLSGGTLDLASDVSVIAHPTTVSGNTIIQSDVATTGAGITHTLGTLSIAANNLTVAAGANVASGTAGLTFGTTTLSGAPTFTINNPSSGTTALTLGAITDAGNFITLKGNGNFAQSAVWGVGSGGGLTLDSTYTGTATLSQANLFTGNVTVKNGTLIGTTSATAFGASTAANAITLGDSSMTTGVTLLGDTHTFANPITVASGGSGTITLGNSGTTTGAPTFGGAITLNKDLTIQKTGTTGAVTVSGGISGSGNLTLNDNATGTITLGTGNINNTGTITAQGTGTGGTTISGIIGTAVTGVTQNSPSSQLTLSGANTFNGGLTIKNGTVNGTTVATAFGGSTGGTADGSGTITLGDATTAVTGASLLGSSKTFANPITVVANANSGPLTISDNGTASLSTFSGAITLSGTPTLTIANSGTTGSTTISGGITGAGNLILNNAATGAGTITLSTGNITNGGTITNTGTGTGGTIISGAIGTAVTNITQNSTPCSLTLSGNNTYSGSTVVAAGYLILSNTLGQCISGTLTVSNAGRVFLGANEQIADATVFVFATNSNGRLDLQGYNETIGGVQDSGGATVGLVEAATDNTPNAPATLTLNVASGTANSFLGYVRNASGTSPNSLLSLTKNGAGTQTFSGDSLHVNYSGPTVINNGVLEFSGVNSVANNSAITVSGGSVMFSGGGTRSTAIAGGAGGVIKNGANTLTLSSSGNTYSGNTTINAGTLALSGSGSIANSANINIATNAIFDVSAVTGGSYTNPSGTTLAFYINKAGSTLTNGQVTIGANNLTYAGTLNVISNANSSAFAAGDSFKLVKTTGGTFSGWFSSVTLPSLTSGLSWNTNGLATSGNLAVYNFTTTPLAFSMVTNTTAVVSAPKMAAQASSSLGTPVAVSAGSTSNGGTASISAGALTYTPASGYVGPDTFTVTYSDGYGVQTMLVTVTVNAQNVGPSISAVNAGGYGSFTSLGLANNTYTVQMATNLSPRQLGGLRHGDLSGQWGDQLP